MKKITKYPETRKEFHDYHILLWTEIIVLLEENRASTYMARYYFNSRYDVGNGLKKEAFDALFLIDVTDMCFACEYNGEGCLLDCKCSSGLHSKCLNGYWKKFNVALSEYNTDKAKEYALKIRNFPLRRENQ